MVRMSCNRESEAESGQATLAVCYPTIDDCTQALLSYSILIELFSDVNY